MVDDPRLEFQNYNSVVHNEMILVTGDIIKQSKVASDNRVFESRKICFFAIEVEAEA